MKNEEKKLTPEEEKELARRYALESLKDLTISNFAAIHFIEQNSRFSEDDKNLMHDAMYIRTLSSKEGESFLSQFLLKNREGGKRYSGTLSELKVLKDCAQIYQNAIQNITPQDLLGLMNSKVQVSEEYKRISSFGDLAKKDEKKFKEIYGTYMNYFLGSKISEAREIELSMNKKSLEGILTGAKPKENADLEEVA